MKTLNLYFDFEFTSLSPDAQPISLGIVSDEKLNPSPNYPVGVVGWDNISARNLAKQHGFTLSDRTNNRCILLTHPSSFKSWVFSKIIIPQTVLDKVEGYELNPEMQEALNDALKIQVVKNEILPSKSFYAEFSDFSLDRCDNWVKENVIKKLRFYPKVGDSNKDGLHSNASPFEVGGDFKHIKNLLQDWLSQFSDYNIQFVSDCGTFDWYWLLQLIGEWEEIKYKPYVKQYELENKYFNEKKVSYDEYEKERKILVAQRKWLDPLGNVAFKFANKTKQSYEISLGKAGLPKLPPNISPVPQDLNDLIAIKKGISVREAFEIDRKNILIENVSGLHISEKSTLYVSLMDKHNSLWDAKVIKEIFNNLNKTL